MGLRAILMKAREIAEVTGGTLVNGDPDADITHYCTDSRQTRRGDFFLALKGLKFDGNDFIPDALARGALGALIEPRAPEAAEQNAVLIEVRNSNDALARLAKHYRKTFTGDIVAVTGSVGKSTAKEYIASVLGAKYKTLRTPLSFNNEIGVPSTLLQLERKWQMVVLELGMRKQGDIAWLCDIAKPTVGVITKIAPTHIGLLGSLDAIAAAKAELFEALSGRNLAVYNADDPYAEFLQEKAKGDRIIFGASEADGKGTTATVSFSIIGQPTFQSGGAYKFRITGPGWAFDITPPLPGAFQGYHLACAAAVGHALGLATDEIIEGIETCEPLPHRLRIHRLKHGTTLIDDAYNASPEAMVAAIELTGKLSGFGKKVAILGDMLELGNFAEKYHRDVGKAVVAQKFYMLIGVGEAMKSAVEEAKKYGVRVQQYTDTKTLLNELRVDEISGKTVLVKGSRGIGLEKVVEALLQWK
ncbi:MAG: UDP-N-acetylmuramoyl-tripeptide--D-alanyl-D-alanine ligase [bacterium]